MKIIKHGTVQKSREFVFRCSRCGCCFVARQDECRVEFDRNDTWYIYKCPNCLLLAASTEEYKGVD